MPIDKFGSFRDKRVQSARGLPGIGFKLTEAGNYDMQNKVLCNVGTPKTDNDVSNKRYVDDVLTRAAEEHNEGLESYKKTISALLLNLEDILETSLSEKMSNNLQAELGTFHIKLDGEVKALTKMVDAEISRLQRENINTFTKIEEELKKKIANAMLTVQNPLEERVKGLESIIQKTPSATP